MSATRYPVFLNLAGRTCVVIGGGQVASRKVAVLVEADATVRVVSPVVCDELEAMAGVEIFRQRYAVETLAGASVVVACTDDEAVNEQIWQDCRSRNILCNVVDDPPRCDFYVPAIVQRGRLQIAVGTGGASPSLAGTIRKELEAQFDASFETWLETLWEVRQSLVPDAPVAARGAILKQLGGAESLERFRSDGLAGWRVWCDQVVAEGLGGVRPS